MLPSFARHAAIACPLIFCGAASAADVVHALAPGLYKIDVFRGDAEGKALRTVKQVESCISAAMIAHHTVFKMLSDHPVSQCPEYNVCGGEFRTGFVAQCIGTDSRSALGMFALGPSDFRGRIDIRNGESKIVGTEIQYGERVGRCPGDGH